MAKKQRKKADDPLLLVLACGATAENAARQCHLSVRTVYRRLEEPGFLRRLQEMKADMVKRTASALTAAGAEAVRTLLELMKSVNPPATRLGSARSVLEIGMKAREFAELEERLAMLEQRAEVKPH
jgi:DNA-binding PadR family transcriptional regulator